MNIDEAIKALKIHEPCMCTQVKLATNVLYTEYNNLVREVARLAIETVKREKEVARLEGDILAWKLNHTK